MIAILSDGTALRSVTSVTLNQVYATFSAISD